MGASKSGTAGQPLFIVDRDWLRQGSKARKSWTGNVRNRSLYGLAIEVTDYDVPQKGARSRTRTTAKRRRINKSGKIIGEDTLQPILTFPSNDLKQPTAPNTASYPIQDPCLMDITSTDAFRTGGHVQLPQPFPRSSTFDSIKGLECYLDYCKLCLMTNSMKLTKCRSGRYWDCTASVGDEIPATIQSCTNDLVSPSI